jgi:hypothetical protein
MANTAYSQRLRGIDEILSLCLLALKEMPTVSAVLDSHTEVLIAEVQMLRGKISATLERVIKEWSIADQERQAEQVAEEQSNA